MASRPTLNTLTAIAKTDPNQAIVRAIHDVSTQLEAININLKKLENEARQIRQQLRRKS